MLVTLLYTTLCMLLMWSSSWVDHERTNLLLIINILLGSSATLQLFLFFQSMMCSSFLWWDFTTYQTKQLCRIDRVSLIYLTIFVGTYIYTMRDVSHFFDTLIHRGWPSLIMLGVETLDLYFFSLFGRPLRPSGADGGGRGVRRNHFLCRGACGHNNKLK